MRVLLSLVLTLVVASPAFATSISVFGRGGGSGKASTLVDDVSCGADEFFRRNAGDDGWECAAGTGSGDSVTIDGAAVSDPDFDDGGDINFTDTANVVTATLKDDVVDDSHLADDDWGDVAIASGVASVQDVTCSNCIDGTDIAFGSDAAGDVAYYNGTDWVRLPAGTAGQVLEMNAGGTAPEWDSDDGSTFDSTAVDATTWSDNANASNIWTFDVSGTDHTMTAGNGVMTYSHDVAVVDDLLFTGASSSLDGLDAIDNTTESTIEGAIDTLSGVACTNCTTVGLTTTLSGISLGSSGVNLDGSNGSFTMLGLGSGQDESLTFDLDSTANTVTITSGSSADTITFPDGSVPLIDLKVTDGQLLNMSAINNSDATEGLRVPQATSCTAGTAEGQLCWDTDDDQLILGDGTSTVTIAGGGSGDIAAVGNCSTGSCFTGASGTQLDSNTDLIFNIDADNDGTETFSVINGADTEVFTVAEDGAVTALLSLSTPTVTLTGADGRLNGLDSVDVTTENTIEDAIDTLSNLTSVGTIGTGVWNAGAVTSSGAVSTATLTLTGDGTINGLDTLDATSEDTIEDDAIFDTDAQNISGVWEVQDDVDLVFGNDANWSIQYDEGVDDQLLIATTGTAAIATTDPMVEILVGTTPTADQQIFGVAKGTQGSNTALFTVDEDGDVSVTGTLAATAYAVAATATPGIDFKDSDATDGDVNASIAVNCTDAGSGTEDCDITVQQQEAGTAQNVFVADADGGITIGSANNGSFTVSTDSTGDAEVSLPTGAIGASEILDDAVAFGDINMTLTLAANALAANDTFFAVNGVMFEGATGGAGSNNEGLLTVTDPTADRTWTLPDATGTVLLNTTAQTRSMWFGAAGLSVDGTHCATPTEVTLGSGPKMYTIICADNDAAVIDGSVVMPDGYTGGDVTFELVVVNDNATPANDYDIDFSVSCRGNSDVINSTYGSEVAADLDFDSSGSCGGSACVTNEIADVTTSAATGDGTCAAGDLLMWKGALDATGTTATVADVHIIGIKMEYPVTLTGD